MKNSGRRSFLKWLTVKIPGSAFAVRTTLSFGSLSAIIQKASAQLVPHGAWKNRTVANTLWTWGANSVGQLGDATTVNRSSPVHIGALAKYNDVSAGSQFSQMIAGDGTLWGMGDATYAQFGAGATSQSSPVMVSSNTTWLKLTSGTFHSLALRSDGSLWSWGALGHANGVALGNGDSLGRSSPVQVGSATDWVRISAYDQSAAIKSDGTLWMWGANKSAQLGDGTLIDRNAPVQSFAGSTWSRVAVGGSSSLGIKTDGTLWTWGNIAAWSSPATLYVPTEQGSSDWLSVASGGTTSIGVRSDGTLWGWGQNQYGQIGDGTTTIRYSPVQVGSATNWQKVFSGGDTSFGLKSDGSLYSWGYGNGYTLGQGATLSLLAPLKLGTATTWKKIVGGGGNNFIVGLRTDGTIWGWGKQNGGLFGENGVTASNVPIQIGTATDWIDIATDEKTVVGLRGAGTVWSWGNGNFGALGNNVNPLVPANIVSGNWKAGAISAAGYGNGSFLGIKADNTLWGYGLNNGSVLGDGTSLSRYSSIQLNAAAWVSVATCLYSNTGLAAGIKADGTLWAWGVGNGLVASASPVQLGVATNWKQVVAGALHFLAVQTNGTLWAFGSNASGQLGNNDATLATKSLPVQIGSDTNWSSVSAGNDHSVATKSDGTIWVWGGNSSGQLGDLTLVNKSSPIQLASMTGAQAAAGTSGTFATQSGTLWAWGSNSAGQLGDGTTVGKSSPIQVGAATSWSKVSAGHSCGMAIKSDGTLWTWGSNAGGQLGDGTTTNRSTPAQVGSATTWVSCGSSNLAGFGIQTDGSLWTWGNDIANGQPTWATPTQIAVGITDATSVSVNGVSASVLRANGTIWGWGYNGRSAIGDGTTINRSVPVQVGTDTDWTFLAKGTSSNYAVKSDTSLWTWGDSNGWYSFARSSAGDASGYPKKIPGASLGWTFVSASPAGGGYAMAIGGNKLYGMGYNNLGQLGIIVYNAVQIGSATTWTEVAAGANHAVMLQSNGTMWALGTNSYGQLGNNSTATPVGPVQTGVATTWSQISAGNQFSIAKKADGSLWGFGLNTSGQLGLNSVTSATTPTQIGNLTNWSKAVASSGAHTVGKK